MSVITKKALAQSLKDLMQTRPLCKITVQNIVDACGLNRQTFYYHFGDVYELLGWIFENEAAQAITQGNDAGDWEEKLLKMFRYLKENRAFCQNTLHSVGREQLERFLSMQMFAFFLRNLAEQFAKAGIGQADQEFIAYFFADAFSGMLLRWVSSPMNETPEQMLRRTRAVFESSLPAVLQRYRALAAKGEDTPASSPL